jgi:hypothetical protein
LEEAFSCKISKLEVGLDTFRAIAALTSVPIDPPVNAASTCTTPISNALTTCRENTGSCFETTGAHISNALANCGASVTSFFGRFRRTEIPLETVTDYHELGDGDPEAHGLRSTPQ